MKSSIKSIRKLILIAILMAATHPASAALGPRAFSVSLSSSSKTVIVGTASNATATVTINEGSTLAASSNGVMLAVSVSPSGQGVTASLGSPGPFTGSSSSTTLTINNTTLAPTQTYTVTVQGSSTLSGTTSNPGVVYFTYNIVPPGYVGPDMIWTAGGSNIKWSTAANWNPAGPPNPAKDVQFYDPGAAGEAGTVNNAVDTNISIGSLTYGQTNGFHTTLISNGMTLTIGGTAKGLMTGTGTDIGDGQQVTAAVIGAGASLVVTNPAAPVYVGQSYASQNNAVASAQATLDLSALDRFTATVSRLLVGVDVSIRGSCGVLNLAKTNVITATPGSTAPQIDIGDNNQAGGSPTIPSILRLGQTNSFFADSITVGRGKTDGTGPSMVFNDTFASPSVYIRGTNGGASRVGTWFIGDGYGSRTYYAYGTCDFSLGTVNALVDTMYIGRGASTTYGSGANNPGFGTLTFTAGNMDVNTLEVGYATANAPGTGTVNANGGMLAVNTLLELAHGSGSSGTLNISNGTVTANVGIISGGGISTINLTRGTLNTTSDTATLGTETSPINNLSTADATFTLPVQGSTPGIAVANLTCGGSANTINVTSVPTLSDFPVQFPIIKYGLNGGGTSGDLSTFVLGTLPPASPPYGGYLYNNVANNSIDVVFTNGPIVAALTWDGSPSGNWDTTTANWRPKSGPNTTFAQGNIVIFNDTLTGTANVNLTMALSPAALTVNNTAVNYVFSGGGSISGETALVKTGSGTLTLAETVGDNFSGGLIVNNGTVILANANSSITGGTTINAGTVQVGNNGTSGLLPSGNVAVSGALVFNRADDVIVSNVISGPGNLTQNNTNILTLSGTNTFAGTVTVAKGTLKVGSTNALGTTTNVTVNSGGTLDVGGFALYGNGNSALVVTIAGAGAGGIGAIINSGTNQTARMLHTVTLAAHATFGGTKDWDIRNSTGSSAIADAQLNGAFNLTKVGTNTVTMRGVTIDPNLGNITVQEGALNITATATAPLNSLGNAGASVTVHSNATFTLDSIGTVPAKNIVLNDGGTLKATETNTIGSPVTLAGVFNNTISIGTGAQCTITSAIGGSGGFSKNGSGTLFLPAANSYSGSTVVSGGTLALYGGGSDGSIASSAEVNITSGAVLDVSGRSDGTFTLTSGKTLSGGVGTNGPGLINGILVANTGSTVAPGSGSTNLGTLAVSGSATLQGITTMKLNATAGTSDQLTANGITFGGTLTVTNFSGTFTNGESFQLFVSSNGYNGNFTSVILPSIPGLTWTNTLTIDGRVTAGVAAAPPQPSFTGVILSGSSLTFSGTNATAGQPYTLLMSTNVALQLAQWATATNGTFASSSFSITITVDNNAPKNFYLLRMP